MSPETPDLSPPPSPPRRHKTSWPPIIVAAVLIGLVFFNPYALQAYLMQIGDEVLLQVTLAGTYRGHPFRLQTNIHCEGDLGGLETGGFRGGPLHTTPEALTIDVPDGMLAFAFPDLCAHYLDARWSGTWRYTEKGMRDYLPSVTFIQKGHAVLYWAKEMIVEGAELDLAEMDVRINRLPDQMVAPNLDYAEYYGVIVLEIPSPCLPEALELPLGDVTHNKIALKYLSAVDARIKWIGFVKAYAGDVAGSVCNDDLMGFADFKVNLESEDTFKKSISVSGREIVLTTGRGAWGERFLDDVRMVWNGKYLVMIKLVYARIPVRVN